MTAQPIAKHAAWSFISQAGAAGLAFASFAVASRYVSPTEFGIYLLAIVVINVFLLMAGAALREPVIQRYTSSNEELSSLFWFSLGWGTLLTLTCCLTSLFLIGDKVGPLIRIASIKLFFDTAAAVPLAIRSLRFRFKSLAAQNLTAQSVAFGVLVLLLEQGWGVYAIATAQVVASVIIFAWAMRTCGWLPMWNFHRTDLTVFWNYARAAVGWQSIDFIYGQVDRAAVGRRFGVDALGNYGLGRRVNDILVEVLASAAASVLLPAFSRISQNIEHVRRMYLKSTYFVALLAFPMMLGLFCTAEPFVVAVLGAKWLPAIPTMQTFALLGFLQVIGVLQSTLIRSLGRPGLWLRYSVIQAVATLIAIGIGMQFSPFWVGVLCVARAYLIWPISMWFCCTLLELKPTEYLRNFQKPFVAAACMAAAVLVVDRLLGDAFVPAARLIVEIAFGAGIYGCGIGLLDRPLLRRTLVWMKVAPAQA
jgi:O-antigen/teichoic acid export membrane protein